MSRPQNVPAALRAHFQRHNRRVVGISVATLGFSFLLWVAAYWFCYWILLLLLTTLLGTEAKAPSAGFTLAFGGFVIGLCLISFFEQRIWPFHRPNDRQNAFGMFMDLILGLPRMTVSSGLTLAAYHSLEESDLAMAWEVLKKIEKDGPLPLQRFPMEIGGEDRRKHVLMALQWSGLVELHSAKEGLELRLANDEAKRLAQSMVRIHV